MSYFFPSEASGMADRGLENPNLWELCVLCLLLERPMHPYEMQRLIRERKKEAFLTLKRGSIYHAIRRLRSAEWIEAVETRREGKRPQRTVYRLTKRGETNLHAWKCELMAMPMRDGTWFFAAISFIHQFWPDEAREQLERRVDRLADEIKAIESAMKELVPRIGRLVLLEWEYALALKRAELNWVRAIVKEIRNRKLDWNPEAINAAVNQPRQRARKNGDESPRKRARKRAT
jgi:DNA-binding PadR family transcriptional regulator